ncbi:hypothetical protein XELAEV_18006811mg [Xenopus laevis]|uniref:Uncharacterized protein n=1 Tax=Xenopus laevis TaxID=8355 RepID=A0A974I4J6_XENLA|nr:hypothetical protein XELAEV_18006811mg [Xenopus laevis]
MKLKGKYTPLFDMSSFSLGFVKKCLLLIYLISHIESSLDSVQTVWSLSVVDCGTSSPSASSGGGNAICICISPKLTSQFKWQAPFQFISMQEIASSSQIRVSLFCWTSSFRNIRLT